MERFWELLENSTLTSGLIASAFALTACYTVIAGIAPPTWFTLALGSIIGFFFGAKALKNRSSDAKTPKPHKD